MKNAREAMALGNYSQAASLFTNILRGERMEPEMLAEVYYERGVARHRTGALAAAISDYTNAVWLGALKPGFEAKVFLARAIAQLQGNQLNRAQNDFDNAVAKDGNLADAYFGRATVRRLQAAQAAAIADYDKALALGHARPALVYYGRGLAYEALGKTVPAAADFAKALQADGGFAPAKAKLAALGLPLPAPGPVAAAPTEGADLCVADASGLDAALGIASDTEATASLAPHEGAPERQADGYLETVAQSGTSHVPAPGTAADKDVLLRPSSDGLLEGAEAPPPAAPESTAAVAGRGENAVAAAPAPVPAEAPAAAQAAGALETETPAAAEVPAPAAAPAAPPAPVAAAREETASAKAPPTALYFVQIASFQKKELAEKGRSAFGVQFPEIAAQVPPSIVEADLGAKGTVYRLRLGPLDSAADSAVLCDTLKKRGQACIVVPPPAAG